jgi:hypothetical protein
MGPRDSRDSAGPPRKHEHMRVAVACRAPWCFTLLVVTATLAAARVDAQAVSCPPVDMASRSPALVAFRQRLLGALASGDTAAIMETVAPGISLGFGGDSGRATFRQWLDGREFWADLQEILSNGGVFYSVSLFAAPYWTTCSLSDMDPFESLVVTGRAVRARSAPSLDSPVLTTLSYVFVESDGTARNVPDGWTAIRLVTGKRGFVASRYLRSPIACRLFLKRRAGRWLLVGYYCGD